MSPQPQIESESMLTALYCVTKIHAESINYFNEEHAQHTFVITLK